MTDAIRLAVLGAPGRMGRAVIAAAVDDARFVLTGAHARTDSPDLGVDAARLAGRRDCGIRLSSSLEDVVANADVVIDFTRPELMLAAARLCAERGRSLVTGTTGMNARERAALETAASATPIFWAPNMSIGLNVLLAALADVAARLGDDYDAEIVEAHHRHKVDAPSGTALALGEVLAAARGRSLAELAVHGREGHSGARERGQIGFHAVRGGELVGEHDVRLISAGEELRLGHTAFSRTAFANGALRAAAWLQARGPGLYGMSDLLKA